jgi:hypothetical protein
MVNRLYYYEVAGTKADYEAGKGLDEKRIGKEDSRIETLLMQEAGKALEEGNQTVRISIEKV